MHKNIDFGGLVAAAAFLAVSTFAGLPGTAEAQSGRIVCWKDKSGKVVGCGDKVPPEYQSSATRELDSRGVTRRQTESVEEANQRRAKEQEAAKIKAEEDKKSLDQKRQDTALLDTFANEKEIDIKRDRDLQALDLQIEQLTGSLKNTTQRYNEVKVRIDNAERSKKPVPPPVKDEFARVTQEKTRFETTIQAKQKEKEELRVKYADYKRRFSTLRARQSTARK